MKPALVSVLIILTIGMGMISCNKLDTGNGNSNDPGNITPPGDSGIPYNFRWTTTREIDLTLNMNIPALQTQLCRGDVYESDPASGGQRLLSGSLRNGVAFNVKMRIHAPLTRLFVVLRTPAETSQSAYVDVADVINYTFQGALKTSFLGPDSDGDGITDNIDDYPADALRAFISDYPATGRYGTFAFEDLWPSEGDYDMNDLVVNYQMSRITNSANIVLEMKMNFFVRAVGGGIRNGLAIQIDSLAPGQVMLVTGSSLLQQYLFLNSNNTESNQTYAVIPVFEDCNDIIHRVGGQFFNTANNGIHGTWDTLRMTVQFASAGLTLSTLSPPFNPFVIKGMNRDFEIHLPDHLPTGLAKTTYFGMHDDDTRPGVGRYYKTHKNLPWGMDFPIPFNYPFENVSLDSAYLHVTQWAVSGGTKYTDWYYNSAPGYRNDSGIYH